MKKMLAFIPILFLSMIQLSCNNDDVKFINEGDNLPVRVAAEFKFNEVSGSTTSETVSGTNYDIIGSGINRMPGVEGNALFFDGLSNEVSGNLETNVLSSSQVVVSLWTSPKAFPVGTAAMLALTSQGSSTGMMVGINKFGQIVVQYFINGAFSQQITNESLPRDKWSHVMVGLNPQNQSILIYLNKQLIRSANVPSGNISWPSGNTPISIGKNTMGEMMGIYDIDYFSGAIDELTIYSGVATQEAVDYVNAQYTAPTNVAYQNNIDFSDDTNRPTYHAIPDFGWANEAYGLIQLNETYHMFYQKNEVFLGIAQQNWGHFTSTDLVNWDEKNAVLWPTEGWDQVGAWSGGSIILNDGTPAVAYTGVDGIKAGVGIATSSDEYQTLDKYEGNPVIPAAPSDVDSDFRDPYVWEKDGIYHMLVGSGISSIGGNVVYYSSPDFLNWTYGGIAFQGQIGDGEGRFWEVPILYEFPNGKEMLLVQKTPDSSTPARTFYWIGQFENGTFTPDFQQAKNLEVVNGYLSPTVTTDDAGLITAIGIIPDEVEAEFQMQQGWANLFSVPQVWNLNANNDILIKPHPNLNALRGNQTVFNGVALQDGGTNYLNNYNGRHFEMVATLNIGTANQIGFVFGKSANGQEEYRVYYDMQNQEWVVDASNASLSTLVRNDIRTGDYSIAQGSTINVRVFVDGSVLEVFIDDKAHFTGRFFPTVSDANGVDLFVTGGNATADVTIYNIDN